MKILVTGGAGYLGSVLVPELLKEGHEVTVLDNFMFKQNSLADACRYNTFFVERGDCRDEKLMKQIVKDKDVIIPLAALVGQPLCAKDETSARTTNLEASKLLLKVCSKEQRILYPTTNSGYGIGEEGKYCTEETPLKPISLYGQTKTDSEKLFLDRGNCITFRLATVFGMSPRMRLDLLVNDFTYRAVNDRAVVIFEGHFKRNYIHIRDVARAFIHGIRNFEKMKNEPYNFGLENANLSKIELCRMIQKHLPKFVYLESPIGEDPDKRDYIVSNAKILKTGLTPKFSIDDGIKELIKGYTILRNTIYSNI